MDIKTIKALIKIAKANLKVARREFSKIKNMPHAWAECEWEDMLEEAADESYACEQVVRFLEGNLELIKNKSNNQ